MKYLFLLLLTLNIMDSNAQIKGFKDRQLKNDRVLTAYREKAENLQSLLLSKGIEMTKLNLYIRVFKRERILEAWGKNKKSGQYQLIRQYDICRSSGIPGPKRKEGDLQVPEGFYILNDFNPVSNFYLSLGINYPNASDHILSDKDHPGSAIYIHGNCVTVGCMPVTDDKIKELYVLAIEAKNNGQKEIRADIFPAKLTERTFTNLAKEFPQHEALWGSLKQGYEYFEKHRSVPGFKVDPKGKYVVSKI